MENNTHFSVVEDAIAKLEFQGKPASLYEPANYMMGLGGKRLRPVFCLLGAELFGGGLSEALNPALAMEVFHNFTLVHDDLMDKAEMRRGQPTVHTKWNSTTAILSGDVMLVLAYELIAKSPVEKLPEILRLFNITAKKVCEGQQLDMEFEMRDDVTVEEYIEMTGLKTAALLAGSLETGAIVAGAKDKDAGLLYGFGYNLGIAFQIQDDLLDSFGSEAAFGKTIGGDITTNKKTFLALAAKAQLTEELNIEYKFINSNSLPGPEKIRRMINIYNTLGIKQMAQAKQGEYYQKAIDSLKAIDVADERKKPLLSLAEAIMGREH